MNKCCAWTWTLAALTAGAILLTLWIDPQLLPLPGRSVPDQAVVPRTLVGPDSYADAVSKAAPAVVNIFSSKVTTERRPLAFKDPFLQHRFGRLLPEQARRRMETSLGSGVILSRDGLLLTNRHIVKDADEIKVVLADGKDLDVRVVGFDPETDLAVLKANASDLPAITIGRPQDLRVGDVVLAIGNPFGIGQTVTMGIVSATGRSQLGISSIENFIQTDASINPGNSGGALINARGELVGINIAIVSQSGGSEGVGFAIPADLATDVMEQVVAQGRVVRGWVGIVGRSVTPQLAESFGLRAPSGVLVSATLEDSPAEHAGLRPGDVVTEVDGQAVTSTHELLEAIAAAGPGTNVELEVWRGSQRIETQTTTIERPLVAKE
ncbi:MAG: trypsin-like peptidase domain-containing protein [Pseudomonadota bacterium]|nr:trypsin-like peptidase domain-containing protein [Pseudomonadota bacterium]